MDGESTLITGTAPGGYQTLTASPASSDGERTTFAATLRPDEPGLEGYLVPFFTLADRGLYFVPGALKRTAKAQLANAPHLHQHWGDLVLGKHTAAFEDEKGFRVAVQINEDKDLGRDVMSDYRFGIPYGWSIGFDRKASRSGTEADDRLLDRSTAPHLKNVPINELEAITEAFWWESSTVTFPAIATAGPDVIQRRGLPINPDIDLDELLSSVRRGKLSPEQRRQIEQLVTAWQERPAPGQHPLGVPDHGTREQQGTEPTDDGADLVVIAQAVIARVGALGLLANRDAA